jgi:N-acetylneuraminate synthase
MSSDAKNVIPGNADESIYEIMERCALSEHDERELKEYSESKGLIFISTPFSRAAADRLESMNVPAYKIGSGECNNYPLIEHIASFGKPMIISTGMNDISSIAKAVKIIRDKKIDYALLHTTNLYPTPENLVRLNAMTEIQESFSDAVIGLSDHTTTNYACFGAVALGASILEKHFTDDMRRPGPDIVCSMDPSALKDLINGSRILKQERGGTKGVLPEEKPTIDFAYACVTSIMPIKKNEEFTMKNIWVKRPGTGEIKALNFNDLLGKKATKDIPNDTQIKWEDVIEK